MARNWWQEAVVYQIYPRSFKDSNGDGIGDLNGIRQKLPYLQQLGVDVLWLSPIYASPNKDNGYDISDYEAIMPAFGTMADFDALLQEAHALGLKVLLDLVVNHTSDQHAWFIASEAGQAPYRDYYLWQDPVDGHAPNAWPAEFGGSAWEYSPKRHQYYLHLFAKQQPDLNWRNPAVRDAVYAMMTRWLEKGIDGFRMDVINMLAKPQDFGHTPQFHVNQPPIHEYLQEMNQRVLSRYDIMTVGEMSGTTPQEALKYTGFDRHELNMIFQFQHMGVDLDPEFGRWRVHPVQLPKLKAIMSRWQTQLNGQAWNALYWNNHDQPRVVSRFGNDSPAYRVASAKMLGAVLHFMQGTPYVYQGEELGMTNVAFDDISDYRDIETLNAYQELVNERQVHTLAAMMAGIHHSSRDNARTPMQWNNKANAGFTTAKTPWIAVNPNYPQINAVSQVNDPDSVWAFYRQMNVLRHQYPVIVYGDYHLLDADNAATWTYQRTLDGVKLQVAANFTDHLQALSAPDLPHWLLGNDTPAANTPLRPYEVRVTMN
ncbi:glycoside hydrolase family 13 protein [Lacticaseibacillus jixiensis]|uniref:glycoside hydrolase family 13 protein n=1 Tax=Lacticaseibacillus jixiensis TaxID=3231926 RepID=UPI0036F43FF7